MAQIYPFRAWRYNPSAVKLDDVVTQPYDKISPAMQQAYLDKSPYNLVRVILGRPEPTDEQTGQTIYTRAAKFFSEWRENGVLFREKEPCVYAYAQRFTVPGTTDVIKERRGFIALGKVQDYSEKVVFRHEQTLSKPKGDRLNLLKATHAHFGQIFMLYSDPAGSVEKVLYDDAAPADVEILDEYNVLHRLWRVSDPATIKQLSAAMGDKKLIIADGHHRYETAVNYAKENAHKAVSAERSADELPQPAFPEAAVMMTFVNMDSDGLVILPTHRVVHSLQSFDAAQFAKAAEQFFTVEKLETAEAAQLIELLKKQTGPAFVAVTKQGDFLLRSKPEAVASELANVAERQRQLDLTHLHSLILDRLLGLDEEKVRDQTNIAYRRDAAESVDMVRKGDAQILFLTNPVTMEQLREVAFAGDVMPQKSTDFFPKLLTGLTMYALD